MYMCRASGRRARARVEHDGDAVGLGPVAGGGGPLQVREPGTLVVAPPAGERVQPLGHHQRRGLLLRQGRRRGLLIRVVRFVLIFLSV